MAWQETRQFQQLVGVTVHLENSQFRQAAAFQPHLAQMNAFQPNQLIAPVQLAFIVSQALYSFEQRIIFGFNQPHCLELT